MQEEKIRYRYLATCKENCIAESSKNHTPSVQLSFLTKHRIEQGNVKTPCAMTLRADLWLTQDAFERSIETLGKCFNWYGEDLMEIHNNRTLFAGTDCILVCEEEEWESEPRLKVRFVNPASTVFAIKKERAEELSMQMNAQLMLFRKKTASSMRTAADLASNTNQPDDTLPF